MVLHWRSTECARLAIGVCAELPYASQRKCTYPGCNVLVKGGRCPTHSTKVVVRDPTVKKLYNSRQWKAMRAGQLASHPWCAECGKVGALVMATEVDHTTPHHGDPQLFFDANNLGSLCKPHHSSKTAEEVLRV